VALTVPPAVSTNPYPFLTWANATIEVTLSYTVNNQYSPLNTDNIYPMKLTGCMWGGVCTSVTFNIVLTKDCNQALL